MGSGFRPWGIGFMVLDLVVYGFRFRLAGFGFRALGIGLRLLDLGFGALAFGLNGLEFRVERFRVQD